MSIEDDHQRPPLKRTDRDEAPLYLARYFERQKRSPTGDGEGGEDDSTPLYLRRFRERRSSETTGDGLPPLWERAGPAMQRALSEDNRNKEISAPPEAQLQVANDIYLVRHGETQGYSTESGLTPLGSWQSRTWGHTLAKRIDSGERVVLASAPTSRAGQTGEHIYRSLLDGLAMFEKDVGVSAPISVEAFRNFAVATPDGLRDVTAAFRQYYTKLEEFERTAAGDRPLWLVEIDRFWRTQQAGGDPIAHWLGVPMLHFEPPAMCVRRLWSGIQTMAAANPGARLVIATHSGPARALATAVLGYDPGEPYNTEHVRVKLLEGGTQALVAFRNRVQEVHVPDLRGLPTWRLAEETAWPVEEPMGENADVPSMSYGP